MNTSLKVVCGIAAALIFAAAQAGPPTVSPEQMDLDPVLTAKILKEKAQQFDNDPEVKQILATLNVSSPEVEKLSRKYSKDNAKALKERNFDANALAGKPLPYERLDQKLFDILMGVK